MKQRNYLYLIRNIALFIVIGLVAACGNEVGDSGTAVPPISLASLTVNVENKLKAFKGNEISYAFDNGAGTTGNLLGFAFCSPDVPLATPAADSTPPTTIYGCDNLVTATSVTDVGLSTVTFSLVIPHAYIDFSGSIPPSNVFDGYVGVTNLVITVDVGLSANVDGTYKLGAVKSIDTVYDAFVIDSNKPGVTLVLNLAANFFKPLAVEQFESLLKKTLNDYLATVPNVTI